MSRCKTVHNSSIDTLYTAAGLTLAHIAVLRGHGHVLEALQELGVSLESPDATGRTALHLAALTGNHSMVKWLLEVGFNVIAADVQGRTPWVYAEVNGQTTVLQTLNGSLRSQAIDAAGIKLDQEHCFHDGECVQEMAEVIHAGITCDGCDKNPIEGPRFKCLVCNDFDFCHDCLKSSAQKHAGHLWIMMTRTPGS